MESLTVVAACVDGRATVTLVGELDMHAVAEVSSAVDPIVDSQAPVELVFDLARLSFIDSSGLGLLVGYRNDGLAAGYRVLLVNVSPRTCRLLELTHLDRAFHIDSRIG